MDEAIRVAMTYKGDVYELVTGKGSCDECGLRDSFCPGANSDGGTEILKLCRSAGRVITGSSIGYPARYWRCV